MTNNQKAFKEAEKELEKDKITEIKEMMKKLLQKIQDQKEIKEKAEENLRLLKLDMEDLRQGKIDKIKKRHDESKKARDVSPLSDSNLNSLTYMSANNAIYTTGLAQTNAINTAYYTGQAQSLSGMQTASNFDYQDATAGTYIVTCSNGTTKEYNL